MCRRSVLGAVLVVVLAIAISPVFFMNDDPVDWRIKYLLNPLMKTLTSMCGMKRGQPFDRPCFEFFIPKVSADNSSINGVKSYDVVIPSTYFDTKAQPMPFAPDDVPARLYVPDTPVTLEDGTLPLLVWMHGGGWTIGRVYELAINRNCYGIAKQGWMVLSVDYRLAPEFPYPHAVEDCYAVLKWLHDSPANQHPALKKVNRNAIIVGGDSAGGNLAAVMALLVRDRKLPITIVHQLLVYPGLFKRPPTKSAIEHANGYVLTSDLRGWFEDQYLQGNSSLLELPTVSPFKAESLSELPPAHVVVASHDPLRDEGHLYYEALRAAGVKARLSEYQNQVHGFYSMEWLEEARQAVADSLEYMHEDLPQK